MAYKHRFLPGTNYSFYNNSDELEDNVNFNYWGLHLVHSDSFTVSFPNVATLSKDIISGTDYRWYLSSFEFPAAPIGCYRFVIEDMISGNILYISNEIKVVSRINKMLTPSTAMM